MANHNKPNQELPTMIRIRFIPAQVMTFPDERPYACKYCVSPILAQRGTADKSVTDLYEDKVATVRCRRSNCGSAFRQYPQGIDRGGQPRRDIQESRRNARRKQTGRARGQVTAIGAHEMAVRVKCEKTDAATGEVLGMALVELDSDGFIEWLGDSVSGYGVEAMVTDDLSGVQAGGRASDLHSPREEAGMEPFRPFADFLAA